MSVSQISVFMQSSPGHLKRILDDFVDKGINVRGYSVSDTGDYGIARFIVSDPEKACEALSAAGCAVTTTKLVCVKLNDTPGELARVMGVFAECGINIEYSYSLISTYIAAKVADCEAAEAALAEQPIAIIHQDDLRNLCL